MKQLTSGFLNKVSRRGESVQPNSTVFKRAANILTLIIKANHKLSSCVPAYRLKNTFSNFNLKV